MKKVLKGKLSADVEEVGEKIAEALKSIKIDEFKNYFDQWKKYLCKYTVSNYQMESTLKMTKV